MPSAAPAAVCCWPRRGWRGLSPSCRSARRRLRAATIWFGASAAGVLGLRLVWWRSMVALRRAGKLTPNIVVVGATANAERLISRAHDSGEVAVLGVFDDRSPGRIRPASPACRCWATPRPC